MMERIDFVPSHQGDNILPADPLFTRLLYLAHLPGQPVAVRDVAAGTEKTHAQLLSDVINLRRRVRDQLHRTTLQDLRDGKEVYIHLLAPGGSEWAVAILAVLALGAIPSPLSIHYPLDETTYFVRKTGAVAILAGSSNLEFARALEKKISSTQRFRHIPIQTPLPSHPTPLSDIVISSDHYCNPNAPGLVIFTSGTTGPPKAVVLRKAAITDGSIAQARSFRLSDQDTILHCLPVHHVTGCWFNFFVFLLAGACIEFSSGSFDPEWTWERFRRGGLTHFSGVPTLYMRMMKYFQENLMDLPTQEQITYIAAARRLRACLSGASALPKPISDWWIAVLQGRRILEKYGASEIGIVINTASDDYESTPDGSCGEASIGVDVKLSSEGEILVKSFYMFSKYLNDPKATREAHTADGYYRTGDIARKEGKHYFITGRASVDIIKSGGYKISALDIEREILGLPYIREVMVVGVADVEYGQKIGAVVSLRHDGMAQQFYASHGRGSESLTIEQLRLDLKGNLAGYKRPTLLRVIVGELPKSMSGKVVKKTLGPIYFPTNHTDPDVQNWTKPAVSHRM